MAQINISSFNVRCFFSKGAFSAICLIIPSQLSQILLFITMDNFHFFPFLPALCRTQSTAINGAGTTSGYGLFRPITTNGRKVWAEKSKTARQKAGYVYFIELLLPASSWLGLLVILFNINFTSITPSLLYLEYNISSNQCQDKNKKEARNSGLFLLIILRSPNQYLFLQQSLPAYHKYIAERLHLRL